jgi:hypothetical protein
VTLVLLFATYEQIDVAITVHFLKSSKDATGAEKCFQRLFRKDGRHARMQHIVARLGRGDALYDHLILEFIAWPRHHPPHPVPGFQHNEWSALLGEFFSQLVIEAKIRPALLDVLITRYRFAASRVFVGKFDLLGKFVGITGLEFDPELPSEEPDGVKAQATMLACRLTQAPISLENVSSTTWIEAATELLHWLHANQPFLRSVDKESRIVLDTKAMQNNQTIAEEDRWFSPLPTPVPDWDVFPTLPNLKAAYEYRW